MAIKKIYSLIGNSNMSGHVAPDRPDIYPNNVNVQQWTRAGAWALAEEHLQHADYTGVSDKVGPGLSFGKTLQTLSSEDIGLIPEGYAGATINDWQKGHVSGLYDTHITRVQVALAASDAGSTWEGAFCVLAENNILYADDYQDLLIQLISDLRSDLGQKPIVLQNLFPGALTYEKKTYSAHDHIVSNISDVAQTSNQDLKIEYGDNGHFNQQSNRALGTRAAYAMRRLQGFNDSEPNTYGWIQYNIGSTRSITNVNDAISDIVSNYGTDLEGLGEFRILLDDGTYPHFSIAGVYSNASPDDFIRVKGNNPYNVIIERAGTTVFDYNVDVQQRHTFIENMTLPVHPTDAQNTPIKVTAIIVVKNVISLIEKEGCDAFRNFGSGGSYFVNCIGVCSESGTVSLGIRGNGQTRAYNCLLRNFLQGINGCIAINNVCVENSSYDFRTLAAGSSNNFSLDATGDTQLASIPSVGWVNEANNDYHLTLGSPLIDAGVDDFDNLPKHNTDFDGITISTYPVGPYVKTASARSGKSKFHFGFGFGI